ncbi:amino acid ABC transporter [Methylobacterium currus]|uniref:Amino acid ABC transporter n=1 Tax=Methylobacterium currus TaxID=2051553 RepID=A0A2R4WUC1_9HYPH|nr:transporter substrate-binding domain-containing protein [Methylobacterium currus]AWB25118.1 amino acid ABC transporter [Methylobacterium currus]UHC19164.1 transporter substrate-binding domain-containing protein [Methylobacterium currus]
MRKIVGVMGVLAALAALPAEGRPLSAIQQDGTLRVGLTGDYAPYSLRQPDGSIKGADVVMAGDLAKALGVKVEIVPTTWKTLKDDLLSDRYDVAMGGVSVTPDRAAVADFSIPVLTDGKRPIVRCAEKDRYVSIKDIDKPEVRVVVNPGGTNQRFADANFPHASVRVFPDNRAIFKEVAEGRADLMVTDGAEVDYQSRLNAGVLCPAAVTGTFDKADKAFWMTRDPALKAAVDGWLSKTLKSGAYGKALAKAAE